MAHLYKSRLQNHAQKKNIPFPMYSCEMQGPPHARLFKARVTIDGATFEGPDFCSTLKDAEHAAAKVAFMSLSPDGTQEDDSLYKSLLQEHAQKKGLLLPVYATSRTGQPHIPCFTSTVEIAGESYVGQEAKTKKQAEINAAKVAYMALTEGGKKENKSGVFSDIQIVGTSTSGSLKTLTIDNKMKTLSINDQPTYPITKEAEKPKGYFGLHNLADGLYMATTTPDEDRETILIPPGGIHPPPQPKTIPNVVHEANLNIKKEKLITQASEGSGSNGKRNQVFVRDDPVKDSGGGVPHKTKIVIRSHVVGMTYEGPIQVSDDEWVAMKVKVEEDEM